MTATAAAEAVTIRGEFQRVLRERGAWFVGLLVDAETSEKVAFSHVSPMIPPIGSELAVTGVWEDRGYGPQLKAERLAYSNPATREGAVRMLKGLPGIGPSRAAWLVDKLGAESAIQKLLANPDQLVDVPGIGRRGADAVKRLKEQRDLFDVESRLAELGLGSALRTRVLEHFDGPENTRRVLDSNPYRLVSVDRVSFRHIDDYLLKMQRFAPDSPFRGAAAIVEALKVQAEDGHTWVPRSGLGAALDKLKLPVPVPAGIIETSLAEAVHRKQVLIVHGPDADSEEGYAAPTIARAEDIIAEYFTRLLEAEPLPVSGALPREVAEQLTDEQRRAVDLISTGNLLVLTGGPGTGKTFTTRAILDILGRERTLIVAPTGKAAKRASELTGAVGETIHRLSMRLANLAQAIRDGELNERAWPSAIIIDEASMLSVDVAAMLLSALDPYDLNFPLVRIVLVGDIDQLPPVGPGAVLRDCLATRSIPCVRLTKIHRQAEGSAIVRNAHRIIHGEKPVEPETSDSTGTKDWYQLLVAKEERDDLPRKILAMHQRIQQRFGIDTREIMVLSPQRAGCVGINALNVALRGILNPPSDDPTEPFVTMPFAERGAAKGAERPTLRRGDRVLVTQNDYRLGVVNGDLGTVQEIIPGGGRRDESGKLIEDQILVAIDGSGEVVTFAGQSITSLRHAYCMSVHKSQGSEARAVIVVASSSHYIMLGRRLLYTAVTRAKELLVLVGDHPGLAMVLRDKTEETRRTRLAGMLAARAVGRKTL